MKIRTLALFHLSLLVCLLSSCTHYYYLPASHNIPLLSEKDQFKAMLSIGGGDDINATELKTAYAVTDNIGVMLNGVLGYGGENKIAYQNYGRGKGIEVGAGYFKPLPNKLLFEVYGGLGLSDQFHNYGDGENFKYTVDVRSAKYFIQPALGYVTPYFDIAISSKFSAFVNNDISVEGQPTQYDIDELMKLQTKTNYFLEPSITIRGGYKFIKFQTQYILCTALNSHPIPYETTYFNIGLSADLRNIFGRNKPKKNN